MHTTTTGNKIKALKRDARELSKDAKAAKISGKTVPEARGKARELESQADTALTESKALKARRQAGRFACVANGEDQDHKERISVLPLLDG